MSALSFFFTSGDIIELRALGKTKGVVQSGYYKDLKKFEDTIGILDKTGEHKGIYFVLNKINPALYARRPDSLSTPKDGIATTSDADIERRRWLPIDFDPKRPSDISSTDEEHEAAIERAKEVRDHLRSLGWPDPVLADSGNGAHLLYAIDLPNNESASESVELVLKALNAIFSDEKIEIDTANFNAARIWKAYGTITRKGGNIPERPWRRSALLEIPAEIRAVPEELLAGIGWGFRQKEQEERYERPLGKIDLEQWLASHGIDILRSKLAKGGGGRIYVLEKCPWDSSHVDRSAWAIQFNSGAIAAGCKHKSCINKGWRDLRELYEPSYKRKVREPIKESPRREEKPHPEISFEDVTDQKLITKGPKAGEYEAQFNADKAADAVINAFSIVSTPDEKIWVYENGYYRNDGKLMIDRILDRTAGKLYTINASKETQKKIFLRTMEDFTIFDQNPYLLCIKNGVVDLLTVGFLEHSPSYYLTSSCPVTYDPEARPTEFIKFLKESCSNDDDRLTLIDWIVACACLTEFEYLLFLTGHGSNGKHVYEAILQAFFGSDVTEAISLEELMNSRFAMGYLRRARICISSETNPNKTKTELIKKISGNDWLSSDVKNKDRARFRAYTQLIFDSNSMPIFEDTSYGFTRRFTRVVMPFKFVDILDEKDPLQKKADRHLLKKLTSDQELSGILNLIILRAKYIALDRKIHRVGDDFERYEEQSYSVSDFIEKFIEFDPLCRDINKWQASSDFIFSKFEEYTKYVIGAKVSRKKFSFILGKENGEASRTVRPNNALNLPVRGFRGLLFDEITFDTFMAAIKTHYSTCNDSTDLVTILKEDSYTNSKDIVTNVTIYKQLLKALNNHDNIIVVKESLTGVVTKNLVEPDDVEKSDTVNTVSDALQPNEKQLQPSVLGTLQPTHHYADDGRDLDEAGEWEDCEYCDLPLPPSQQNNKNGWIFCSDCLKVWLKRQNVEE